jgi:DNA-binding NarL/FixJ family response regulator
LILNVFAPLQTVIVGVVFSLLAEHHPQLIERELSMVLAKVMLIDDDVLIRTTMSSALQAHGIHVSGVAESAQQAIEILTKKEVEVAIVDLDLGPGPSGIDICNALRIHDPNLGLILLTSYLDPRIHDPANSDLPRGCRFISKNQVVDMGILVKEILIAREKPLMKIKMGIRDKTRLTNTQIEVLIAVAQGLSSQQIADNRSVSVKAIEAIISKTHKALGMKKSKSLNSRVQLARKYFQLSGKNPPSAR